MKRNHTNLLIAITIITWQISQFLSILIHELALITKTYWQSVKFSWNVWPKMPRFRATVQLNVGKKYNYWTTTSNYSGDPLSHRSLSRGFGLAVVEWWTRACLTSWGFKPWSHVAQQSWQDLRNQTYWRQIAISRWKRELRSAPVRNIFKLKSKWQSSVSKTWKKWKIYI